MIKLKEIEKVYLEQFDIHVNPYLSLPMVEMIGSNMLKYNVATQRNLVKATLIMQHCTDVGKDFDVDYDTLKSNGVLDSVYNAITNIDDIDEYINLATSPNVQINEFLTTLSTMIDKNIKNMPSKKDFKTGIDVMKAKYINDKK